MAQLSSIPRDSFDVDPPPAAKSIPTKLQTSWKHSQLVIGGALLLAVLCGLAAATLSTSDVVQIRANESPVTLESTEKKSRRRRRSGRGRITSKGPTGFTGTMPTPTPSSVGSCTSNAWTQCTGTAQHGFYKDQSCATAAYAECTKGADHVAWCDAVNGCSYNTNGVELTVVEEIANDISNTQFTMPEELCCSKSFEKGSCSIEAKICISFSDSSLVVDKIGDTTACAQGPPHGCASTTGKLTLNPVVSVTVSGDCSDSFSIENGKELTFLKTGFASAALRAGYEFEFSAGIHGSVTMRVPAEVTIDGAITNSMVPYQPATFTLGGSGNIGEPDITTTAAADVTISGGISIGFEATALEVISVGAAAVAEISGEIELNKDGIKTGSPQISLTVEATAKFGLDIAAFADRWSLQVCDSDISAASVVDLPFLGFEKTFKIWSNGVSIPETQASLWAGTDLLGASCVGCQSLLSHCSGTVTSTASFAYVAGRSDNCGYSAYSVCCKNEDAVHWCKVIDSCTYSTTPTPTPTPTPPCTSNTWMQCAGTAQHGIYKDESCSYAAYTECTKGADHVAWCNDVNGCSYNTDAVQTYPDAVQISSIFIMGW
jgi:hypothetical protein